MTKIKSAVVSRTACAQFSKEFGLGGFLFLGRGMKISSDLPANLLADVFESMVAAIYLDGGMEAAQPFILRFITPEIDRVVRDAANNNYKSLLQQVAQREFGGTPRYQVLDEQGPDHSRSFKIAVRDRHASLSGRLGPEQEDRRVAGRPECPGRNQQRADPLRFRCVTVVPCRCRPIL